MGLLYRADYKLVDSDADKAAALHASAFRQVNKKTVQRHTLNRGELDDVFGDDRIRKFTAWDEATGDILGLSLETSKLAAHPLISLEFFEEHYPEQYARQSIWYIMTVCVDIERRAESRRVFPALIRQMMQPIRATRGMGVLDYSSYLIATTRLDLASRRYIAECAPLDEVVDLGSQHHVAYTFDWDKEAAA